MKILAKPAYSNKAENPYNYLLYSRMEEAEDYSVDEFSLQKALLERYDILHFHWPDVMLFESNIRSVCTVIAFLLLVRLMKWRGTKFFWTMHDLRSHRFPLKSDTQQAIEQWYMDRYVELLDGVIALSKKSLIEAKKIYPNLAKKQSYVIPHGHYKDIYSGRVAKSEARSKLGIDENETVVTFFGKIRPYKNVPQLIRVFSELNRNDCTLLIAGNPTDEKIEQEITSLVEDSEKKIRTMLRFIADDEIVDIFSASDLVVIPYKNILNSGSVLLSLSFDVPVLVPHLGSMIELNQQFGEAWVKTYRGELSADLLEARLKQLAEEEHHKCEKIDNFGWDQIAQKTLQAYQKV